MATFHVTNFGCRATQADGAAIERQFQDRGFERAQEPARAGIVILNTCTVTAAADQDARAAIRRIHRQNPEARIVVTGCYAQRAPQEIAALPGVACVIGNSHKHQLAEIAEFGRQTSDRGPRPADLDCQSNPQIEGEGFVPLAQLMSEVQDPKSEVQGLRSEVQGVKPDVRGPRSEVRSPIFVSDIFAHTELKAAPVFDAANERTRPNLKVQDGCDNRCSFCVIPYVRGQSRSLKLAEVIGEVNELVAAGYREVVISGINLGRWGRDLAVSHQPSALGKTDRRPPASDRQLGFEHLVRAILSETALQKLRISSVEPMDWSEDLIQLMAMSPRIAKHAHVPMQSGSDAVLRRMHRKYRLWHYREKIEKIRAAMPSAAIGADVMAGFPGETDFEFEETRRLVEDLPFTYLHVFTYSARPGTPAAAMGQQVPVQVARERNRSLREIAAQKKLSFMQSFVGKPLQAITLRTWGADTPVPHSSGSAFTEALTDNYLALQLKGSHPPNRWIHARVEQVCDGTLQGVIDTTRVV